MGATGLKKGGIYNHFSNKDEIALAAFDHSFQRVLQHFRKRLAEAENSLEKLDAIIECFRDYIVSPVVRGGCPIINTAIDSTESHPALKERAREAVRTLETYIEIKIEDGKTNGVFKADADSKNFAAFMMFNLEGAVLMSRVNNDLKYLNLASQTIKSAIRQQLLN